MKKMRLRKGAGPCSRSQGTFPAEPRLEARPTPNRNALSTHPAGSCPWPPTTVSYLSRHCNPDRPPPHTFSILWRTSGNKATFSWSPKLRRIRKMKPLLGKTIYKKENVGNVGKWTQLAFSKWLEGRWCYLCFP